MFFLFFHQPYKQKKPFTLRALVPKAPKHLDTQLVKNLVMNGILGTCTYK